MMKNVIKIAIVSCVIFCMMSVATYALDNAQNQVESQAVQMFNAQWEGFAARTQGGAQIRNMINQVNTHNARDAERGITLTKNDEPLSRDGLGAYSSSDISSDGSFDVTATRDEDGFITELNIDETNAIGNGSENTPVPTPVVTPTPTPTSTPAPTVEPVNTPVANETPTDIPQTGLGFSIIILIAICGACSLYAYKKIRQYKIND